MDARAPILDAPAAGTRTDERTAMLITVGRLLTGADHADDARREAARATLPVLGDLCVVDLVDTGGELRRSAVVHRDPRHEAEARALARAGPSAEVRAVLRDAEPAVLTLRPGAVTEDPSRPTEPVEALMLPLVARGATRGVLIFLSVDPERGYGADDVALGAEVALRFALHADAARALGEARAARERSDAARAVLESVYAGSPVGLAHLDPDLRVVRLNRAFRDLADMPVLAPQGTRIQDVLPTCRPPLQDIVARSAEGPVHDVAVELRARDGSTRHLAVSCVPVTGTDGRPGGVSLAATDVTDRERADRDRRRTVRHLAALAAVGEVLDARLALTPTLHRIVRIAVEHVADWALVHMTDEEDGARLVASAYRDPDVAGPAVALEQAHPRPRPDAPAGVARVLSTGRPVVHAHLDDAAVADLAQDEAQLALLRRLRPRSIVIVPLTARGAVLGTLTLVAVRTDREADAEEIGFIEELGRRSALAVDAARLLAASDEARVHAETTLALERRTHQALQAALNRSRILSDVSGILERSLDLEALDQITALLARWLADDVEITIETPHLGTRHARSTRTGGHPVASVRERTFVLGRRRRRFGSLVCRWWSTEATPDEAALLQEIAERLTVTTDAADLSAERTHTARTLQGSLLPAVLPVIPGVVLAGRYFPALGGGEVGGDFYDVFPLGDGTWMVVVGDVCGKGVAAATVTAQARYTLRALAPQGRSPSQVLRAVNDALVRQGTDGRFVTLAVARLGPIGPDGRARVDVACGGHPEPFVLRRDGGAEVVPARGQLVGVLPEIGVRDTAVLLAPGDVFVAYTDGVTEADPYAPLDGRAIADGVANAVSSGPSGVALAVESLARGHAGSDELPDDLAILALTLDP